MTANIRLDLRQLPRRFRVDRSEIEISLDRTLPRGFATLLLHLDDEGSALPLHLLHHLRMGIGPLRDRVTSTLAKAYRPPNATMDRGAALDGRRCESQLSSVSLADATRGSDSSNGMPSSTLTTIRRPLCLRRGSSQTHSMVTEKDDRWSPLTIPSWSKTTGILVQRMSESMAANRFTALMEI